MRDITRTLFVILIFVTEHGLAQEYEPVSSITNATWAQYSDMYQPSPLCSKDEVTLWSCKTSSRIYSLCSSHTVTRVSGYMQYRVSRFGEVVFTYPAEKKPPLGSFIYNSFPNGNASIEFTSNGYRYTLFDPLKDVSFIYVAASAPSKKEAEIRCSPNQTLQINYTMRLMYDSGVWDY